MSSKYVKPYSQASNVSSDKLSDDGDDKKVALNNEILEAKVLTPKTITDYLKCNPQAIQELEKIEQYQFNIFKLQTHTSG